MFRIRALSFGVLLVMTASPPVGRAANDVWDGNGNVPPSNNWSFDPSWVDNSAPGNSDSATFNIAGTYTVSFSVTNLEAIQALTVSSGHVTFASTSSTARTLPVNSASGTQDVLITGSSTRLTLGASPANAINLLIGNDLSVQDDAILIAQFGSDITASDFSTTGLNGTIVLDSSSSKLTLNGAGVSNFIGRSGHTGDLAFQSGSTGNSIAGNVGIADSSVANSQGFVSVQGGASVSLAGNLTMANQNVAGQVAVLGIDGTNSAFTQTGASSITVGSATNGTASIEIAATSEGGTLTTGTGPLTINATGEVTIGAIAIPALHGTLNANGNVLINGGVLRRLAGTLIVAPTKTVTVQNGGLLDIRSDYDADATYMVTDSGSSFTTGVQLSIGGVGTGSLTNSAGGIVSSNSGRVGRDVGSNGTVIVTGAGSTWINTADLYVGDQGTGSLRIEQGGAVSSGAFAPSEVGRDVGSDGTVTVTGTGSTWTINTDLLIGDQGTGRLTIESGGAVEIGGAVENSLEGHIGAHAGSNGTVTVNGSGSAWTITSSLIVGDSGNATLLIENGGVVSSGGTGAFLAETAGTSTVTVTGAGSRWTNVDLEVGFASNATLTIADGGMVSDRNGTIGHFLGGVGSVTVTGSGSTWTNSGQLHVAINSTGSVSIEQGGAVTSTGLATIGESVGAGTVTVTGIGSTWTSSSLAVGGSATQSGGTGSLTMSSGGLVRVNGSTILWANGTVGIQGGGTFNANDNFTIDAGVLTRAASGSFNLAAGKTMTIQNSGRASFTGGYTTASNATYHVAGGRLETLTGSIVVGNGAQLNVDSGGTVSATSFLDIGTTGGDGTLTVSGNSSSVTSTAPSLSLWASDSHIAHITFSNNATGSFPGGISVAPNGTPGTTADIHILSGAGLTLTTLFLDSLGGTNASVAMTVDGAGSSVTQTGNSMLTVGSSTSGKAQLVVRNNALFTTGTNSIFIAPTGTVELNSGAVLDARGTITMSGTFNFLGGTLHVDNYTGDLDNQGGTLAPGHSAGTTSIVGAYTQLSPATLQIEIGGTTPGSGAGHHDQVNVAGAAALGGTLDLVPFGGFVPIAGDKFVVMNYASATGTVATVTGTTPAPGLTYTPVYSSTNLTILTTTGEKTWAVDSSGNASVGTNWTGGVAPGGVGDSATFSTIITAPRTVTVDADTTIGTLKFDSPIGYTIAGPHAVTFQATGSNTASINVVDIHGNGAHTISAPLMLASDLNIVQNSSGTLRLSGSLDDSASRTITKSGTGTVEIDAPPTLGASTTINAAAGTFRFAVTSGGTTIGAGVQVHVSDSATLELAGSASALSSGLNRTNISNNSTSPAGLLVTGTNQVVGNVDGSGTTQVNAGSDLSANHIVQSALMIGGTAGNHGLVTIDASDPSGNPLDQSSGFALANSLTPSGPFGAGGISSVSLSSGAGGGTDLAALALGYSAVGGNSSTIPEPSTLLLALLAVLGVAITRFARHHFRWRTV